jgi:hypothetical protein
MKHLMFILTTLLNLVLALSVPLNGVGAEGPLSGGALPLDQIPGGFQGPTVRESSGTTIVIRFKSPVVLSGRLAYGADADYGSSVDISAVKPAANHDVKLAGLKAGSTYHYRLTLADAKGQVYESADLIFTTPAPSTGEGVSTERPREENVASLAAGARISQVSSNLNNGDNSSEFGALKAIDGLDNTEWASNGQGNQAWIEIELAQRYRINTVGFRSRNTPDGNGRVLRFTVTTDEGKTSGPFALPGADRIYYFPVDITARTLRFSTVETSGGNTGAVALEAFGAPAQ